MEKCSDVKLKDAKLSFEYCLSNMSVELEVRFEPGLSSFPGTHWYITWFKLSMLLITNATYV